MMLLSFSFFLVIFSVIFVKKLFYCIIVIYSFISFHNNYFPLPVSLCSTLCVCGGALAVRLRPGKEETNMNMK